MREAMVGRGAVREGGPFESGPFFLVASEMDKEPMAEPRRSEEVEGDPGKGKEDKEDVSIWCRGCWAA